MVVFGVYEWVYGRVMGGYMCRWVGVLIHGHTYTEATYE